MTDREVKDALISFGYREHLFGVWLKPVGFHLFTFEVRTRTWSNWFKDVKGKQSIYESKVFVPDTSYLTQLKHAEAYTRINVDASATSEFHLSSFPEGLEDLWEQGQ